MRETGNFFQHDLEEIIAILHDTENELKRKTTSVGAEVAK